MERAEDERQVACESESSEWWPSGTKVGGLQMTSMQERVERVTFGSNDNEAPVGNTAVRGIAAVASARR